MLKVDHLHAEDYLRYVAMGPSGASAKSECGRGNTLGWGG